MDQRGQLPVLVLARVAEPIPEEVDRAALPRRPEDLVVGLTVHRGFESLPLRFQPLATRRLRSDSCETARDGDSGLRLVSGGEGDLLAGFGERRHR
jgi:hypothetical protein